MIPTDRLWLVLLGSPVQNWKETLPILKPDTLLRWHPQGFRLFWKFKLFFRLIIVFFIVEPASRRIVYFGVTRSPMDEWVAQQLREATPFG